MTGATPAIFVSHGSPMVAIEDDDYTAALRSWGKSLGVPRSIVAVSSHWEDYAPIRVTGAPRPETIHDFGGFPEELYQLTYPCPGHPALAVQIIETLHKAGFESMVDEARGLDHAVWIPLRHLFPKADIPVVEISLCVPRSPEMVLKMGAALSTLRSAGCLLMGTGGIVHNLGRANFRKKYAPVDAWAKDFDTWIAQKLTAGDAASLLNYRRLAPYSDLAVPTADHFDPLFFALGAALERKVMTIYDGFHHANLSMRLLQFD